MNLNLYNEDMERIAIIGNNFVSCLWSEGYNSVEPFCLEVRATSEYKEKIRPDLYVGRDDRKTLMVIKTVESKGNLIVASGKQATRVLDDVAFVGTLDEGTIIDTGVFDAYNKSTKFHNLSFARTDLGISYNNQISNKSFLKLCETMCKSEDAGFRVVRKGKELIAEFYRPNQREKIKLSELFGNVKIKKVLLSTEKYKNCAIVLGDGEGSERTRIDVDLSAGESRREMIVDARDIRREENELAEAYNNRLYARGLEKLLTQTKAWEFSILPLAKEFGTKYDLGDILEIVLSDYNIKLEARVSRFTQKEQKNQIETIVEIGNIVMR